jgi:four helix bundle protein
VNGCLIAKPHIEAIFHQLKFLCMFLQLNHQKLEAFKSSKVFVLECYKLTKTMPIEEKFGMISQIRRAALSVYLNIAEGASRKSEAERKRYYEIARGSLIEIDAALEIAKELGYLANFNIEMLGKVLIDCFKMLTGLINQKIKT